MTTGEKLICTCSRDGGTVWAWAATIETAIKAAEAMRRTDMVDSLKLKRKEAVP